MEGHGALAPGDGRAGALITLSAFVVAPCCPGGSGPAPGARSGPDLGASSAAAADTVDGRPTTPTPALVAAGGDLRHRVVARPAGHDVGRHRPARRRVLPHDGRHDHGGQRALPRAAATDAVRQGVHRRRFGHRQHQRRLPRRPGLHRGHRRRARHRATRAAPSTCSTPCSRPTARRWHVGGQAAAVQRRGRPVRRVLHGHQPVPDGAGGRATARRSRRCSRSSRATTCTPTP